MNDIRREWDKYYSEFINLHRNEDMDLFQLTNGAINYSMKKLGLEGRNNTQQELIQVSEEEGL